IMSVFRLLTTSHHLGPSHLETCLVLDSCYLGGTVSAEPNPGSMLVGVIDLSATYLPTGLLLTLKLSSPIHHHAVDVGELNPE
ncbi:hypothetical protein ISN45_Aa01g000090, partial [Arabidopsis thaliana x Arabidopsis arenosa]